MTQVTWFARLVGSDGAPATNVAVQLQLFDLTNGWQGIGDATTNADGRVRATSDVAGPGTGPAPMLRLMETDAAPAVLGGVPTVSASGTPPALACDFGEIVHVPDRFSVLRASAMRFNLRPTDVAGVTQPAAAARPVIATALGGLADTGELQARVAEAKQAQAERDDARTQLNLRLADIQKLQADNTQVRADLDTRTAAIKAVQAERDDAKTQLNARLLDVQNLRAENATIRSQATINADALKAALAERDDVRNRLAGRETDVQKLVLERDQVKAQLADSEKRLSDLRTAGTATAAAAGDISLGAFATRVGGEIDSAQNALKNRGFSLGRVSVIAPALQKDDTSPVEMAGVERLKTLSPELISKISIDYHPSPETDAAGTGVQVPDIRQLTESAARRVLVSVGLALEVTQGPPSIDPTCAEGQVMLQSPRAGDTAPRGTRVTAIFSRAQG